ncbi:hypothetical protein Poly21_17040 [Allorhodopirellula heiligendammensis]|uniref:Sce7726 family protein n=1 Tax=Allorhodopirellula heiligendammensis TaxID=2714739 RepID=A0A5C6C4J3_9BACT|nr:hypothetical protein Poly21_17040 [Allorhodopirellula heiligendammensis]
MDEPITETELREAMRARLQRKHVKTPTLIVDELGVARHSARADLAVVNGALHCVEIKSDRDNLSRLPNQLEHYEDYFHTVTVATTSRHVIGVTEFASPRVGIVVGRRTRSGTIALKQTRPTLRIDIDPMKIAQLIWYDELGEAMERRGWLRGNRKLDGKSRREFLVQRLKVNELLDELRLSLAARRERQRLLQRTPSDGSTRRGGPVHARSTEPLVIPPLHPQSAGRPN